MKTRGAYVFLAPLEELLMTLVEILSIISLVFTVLHFALAFDSYMESKKKNDR